MMFYVYIIFSEKHKKFYIGQTNNFEDRIRRHNAGSEKYTSKYKPWKLVLKLEMNPKFKFVVQCLSKMKCMLRYYLTTIIVFFYFTCLSQDDVPLPLGPSTIDGKVLNGAGEPIENAKIKVIYPNTIWRKSGEIFYSDKHGNFTAYILKYNQEYIDLKVIYKRSVCDKIRYNQPGRGLRLGINAKEIICD